MVPFVPLKSDIAVANELRAKFELALGSLCALCDEAKVKGLTVNFGVGPDYRGVTIITQLKFSKEL